MELFNMLGKISPKDFLKIREPKKGNIAKKEADSERRHERNTKREKFLNFQLKKTETWVFKGTCYITKKVLC